MVAKSTLKRGSQKLIDKGAYKTHLFTQKELAQFTTISKKRGARLVDWCIYGQPAPDGVCGRYQVTPGIAGNVISDLIRLKGFRLKIDVFPLGIPVVDNVLIEFKTPRGVIITDG